MIRVFDAWCWVGNGRVIRLFIVLMIYRGLLLTVGPEIPETDGSGCGTDNRQTAKYHVGRGPWPMRTQDSGCHERTDQSAGTKEGCLNIYRWVSLISPQRKNDFTMQNVEHQGIMRHFSTYDV